jgi:hypothetical protein
MTLWADFSLQGFKDGFEGGARAYLFEMGPPLGPIATTLNLILSSLGGVSQPYYVRSSTLPGVDIEEINTNYMGAEARWAGSKRYSDWTVTYNMDIKGYLRLFFEAWMSTIHDPVFSGAYGDPSYFGGVVESIIKAIGGEGFNFEFSGVPFLATLIFSQLDYEGHASVTYILNNAWPKSIGPATMDYSSQDTTQFDVTFSYLYHICSPGAFIPEFG